MAARFTCGMRFLILSLVISVNGFTFQNSNRFMTKMPFSLFSRLLRLPAKPKKKKGPEIDFSSIEHLIDDNGDLQNSLEKKNKKPVSQDSVRSSPTNKVKLSQMLAPECLEERVRRERPAPKMKITESAQPGFVSLGLHKVSVVFGDQQVVKEATWDVKTGDRVGLVGGNGCGKTTMVKILAGDMEATSGEILKIIGKGSHLKTAFLRQEFIEELVEGRSLFEELMSVFHDILKAASELKSAQSSLGTGKLSKVDRKTTEAKVSELQRMVGNVNVHALKGKIEKVMFAMGFVTEEGSAPVSSFSGGWKMRIGLAKILLQDPNIILLDEPTNHLDLDSVVWLEQFLIRQNIPMVIVSHDREFLDQVCNKIVDCMEGVTTTYKGDYAHYLRAKKANMEAWAVQYEKQQKSIKEDRKFINSNRNKQALSASVKQRQVRLDKLLASSDFVTRPPYEHRKFLFRFPDMPASVSRMDSNLVFLDNVTHGYHNNLLLRGVDLSIGVGDRVALVGPNGCGKSSLMRCMLGSEAPSSGQVIKSPKAVVSYFEQNQADALDLNSTVMHVVESATVSESYEKLRELLGKFLFKGSSVKKQIRVLSGGEKARVALCRMILTPANVLFLDEPTNHLDIGAKEVLEEALQNFQGTIVVISHDRYFISKIATKIIAIENLGLTVYPGDFKDYMRLKPDISDKVTSRFISGDRREITKAQVIVKEVDTMSNKKRNFGGSGATSGNKFKGVKNAHRFS